MNRKDFRDAMAVLQTGVNRVMLPEQMEVWFDCLKDLEIGSFRHAVKRWLCEVDSGWPSIAKLREFAAEYGTDGGALSGQAFESLMASVRKFGFYRQKEGVASLDARTRSAMRNCGGWRWACDCSEDNRQIYAAQFRRAYEAITHVEQTAERLPQDVVAMVPRLKSVPEEEPNPVRRIAR